VYEGNDVSKNYEAGFRIGVCSRSLLHL
jgi:hypothetical protein